MGVVPEQVCTDEIVQDDLDLFAKQLGVEVFVGLIAGFGQDKPA